MIRGLLLALFGVVLGFLFTLTYTGVLLRDAVILKIDDLVYKVPYKAETWMSQQDWKLREYLVKQFPVLDPVDHNAELK